VRPNAAQSAGLGIAGFGDEAQLTPYSRIFYPQAVANQYFAATPAYPRRDNLRAINILAIPISKKNSIWIFPSQGASAGPQRFCHSEKRAVHSEKPGRTARAMHFLSPDASAARSISGPTSSTLAYFSLTNSSTKIAHTPTVIGNTATDSSRKTPPRGNAKVSAIIARAVSTPTANLAFEFMVRPFPFFAKVVD
jgi:hypothetical protein